MEQAGGSNKRQREEGSERGLKKKSKDTTVSPLVRSALESLDAIHATYNKEMADMHKAAREADLKFLVQRAEWDIFVMKLKVASLKKKLGIQNPSPH